MASQSSGNAVLLTVEESEKIKRIAQNRRNRINDDGGQKRKSRDVDAEVRNAKSASFMADMGSPADPDAVQLGRDGASSLPLLILGQTYPPCPFALAELEPIGLSELTTETHHCGRFLRLKRISPAVTLAARTWTVFQDNDNENDSERFALILHTSTHGEDVLESCSTFIVKDPYLTTDSQGETQLQVNHPSDLIVVRGEAPEAASEAGGAANRQTDESSATVETATAQKDKGNAALKRKEFLLAHAHYSEGIRIALQKAVKEAAPSLSQDIARNRSHVNLLLRRHDEALSDALSAVIGADDERSKSLDSKAYFRAGSGAYHLGQYEQAAEYFEKQKKLAPEDKEPQTYLKQISARRKEQETGGYDFVKIRARITPARPEVDAADFLGNTKIGDSPGRGRGLSASREIAVGEIIMCEKAVCVVWGHQDRVLTAMTYDLRDDRIRVAAVGLTKAIVERLMNNPSLIPKVTALYGDYSGDDKTPTETSDGPVVDTFQIQDIISRNAFGPGSQFGEQASTGLWIHAAYVNHSCLANARKEYIGDLIILRATRKIAKGEEIFHSYDESTDYDSRQASLMTTWGFECDCTLCQAEKADGKQVRDKRRELEGEAAAFVNRESWAGAKRLTIAKAERLARALNETYDKNRYDGLPRNAILQIQEWLGRAKPRK